MTKSELKPYLQMVLERRAKHPEAKAWATMEARWNKLVELMKPLAEYQGPTKRYGRIAAREIVKLGTHVETRKIVDTVLAMYLLQEFDARRFKSDEAFWAQLVRRTRGLARANYGTWTNPSTGKPKSAAKELEPKAAQAMAGELKETLGVAGTWLANLEKREEEQERRETLEFYDQLKELA